MTSYIYNMVDTWNDGATTFTAVKMNVTDTASNAASNLMDLQIGGSSRFQVAKDGAIGIPSNKSLYQIGNPGFNIAFSGLGVIALNSAASAGITVNGPVTVGATDLILSRRAAANLRLGAADAAAPVAQTLSVQSVVAGTSNTAGANLTITGSQGTGTGAGGSIIFQVAPAGGAGTAQNALATAWSISGAGNILAGTDGIYDIGASGATRPRTIYLAADVYLGDSLRLANANLRSLTSGCIRLTNSAASDFDRLQFGGTTSSFPSLKRSTTALEVRLADDSAYATFSCLSFNAYGSITLRGSTESARRLAWNGVGQIRVQSDGVFTIMNDAATDFSRLQFGGTDANFPALKRSTTSLQAVLANDTGFATIQGKLRADVNAVAETPTATHTITITDAAGTAYKVLCVAD